MAGSDGFYWTLLPAEELHRFFEEAFIRWENFQGHRPLIWHPVLGWTKITFDFEVPTDATVILESLPPERRTVAEPPWSGRRSIASD